MPLALFSTTYSSPTLMEDKNYPIDLTKAQYIAGLFMKEGLPQLISIWPFGSYATNEAISDSDIDLAVLCERQMSNIECFTIAQKIAAYLGKNVDLVDIRKATPYLSAQVFALDGIRFDLIQDKAFADHWEVVMMSRYCYLNEERKYMADDVALNKIEIIERCLTRIKEEYNADPRKQNRIRKVQRKASL